MRSYYPNRDRLNTLMEGYRAERSKRDSQLAESVHVPERVDP
jgi:hypothetical protein